MSLPASLFVLLILVTVQDNNLKTKMPPKPKTKPAAGKEEDHEELVEGVSSAHSWIKVQTMIRPTKLGKKRGDDDDDDDGEESSEIMLTLTSRNPNETTAKIWWVHEEGEFKQVAFQESIRL